MKDKKKYILIAIATVLIMVLIVFLVGRSFGFFRYIKKGDITNVITINGITIDILNEESDALNLGNAYPMTDAEGLTLTPFVFTMTNKSKRDISYSIRIENDEDKQQSCSLEDQTICPVLTTNYIKYSYKKDDGTYSEPKLLSSTNGILSSGQITGGESITSSIILWIDSEAGNEIQNHYFFGKVIITGEHQTVLTFKDTILANNKIVEAEPTLTTSSANSNDASGLYKSTATNSGDPTYYFRGNVENNYVEFAEQTWRIVRINEDGTIRLIMQNGINDNNYYTYNSSVSGYKNMYYSNSEAKILLSDWYNTNIINKGYSSKVATGNYFCEQAKVKFGPNYTSGNVNMTVYSEYTPNYKCSTDQNGYGEINSSIGLLTYDEVVHAGGYLGLENTNYYLNNNSLYWLMSPAGVFTNSNAIIWFVDDSGYPADYFVNYNYTFRPVINLKADTIITGTGTSTDPYKIKVQETDSLTIGQSVTASDGSKWHVLEDSSSDSKYVTLLSDYNLNSDGSYNTTCTDVNGICSPMTFDSDNTNTYDETDSNNIGYFIKNTYSPLVTSALPGTTNVTLPTANQIATADGATFSNASLTLTSSWLLTSWYWTKTSHVSDSGIVWNVVGSQLFIDNHYANNSSGYGARPVITTLKTNLILN